MFFFGLSEKNQGLSIFKGLFIKNVFLESCSLQT